MFIRKLSTPKIYDIKSVIIIFKPKYSWNNVIVLLHSSIASVIKLKVSRVDLLYTFYSVSEATSRYTNGIVLYLLWTSLTFIHTILLQRLFIQEVLHSLCIPSENWLKIYFDHSVLSYY